MKTEIIKVTPAMAAKWLDNQNPRNRKLVESRAQAYATDMRNGKWFLTHQGIAFYEDDTLADGQHRLWGIVLSDTTQRMVVATGMPLSETVDGVETKIMDLIDNGAARSIRDQFQLAHDVTNASACASAAQAIIRVVHPAVRRVSTSTAWFVFSLYREGIEQMVKMMSVRRHLTGSFISGPLAMYHLYNPVKAVEFMSQFSSYENTSQPVRQIITYLERRQAGDRDSAVRAMGRCIRAFDQDTTIDQPGRDRNGDAREYLMSLNPGHTRKVRDCVRPISVAKKVCKPKLNDN